MGTLSGAETEPFDDLALALARFQAAHVPALGRLVRARGLDLASARDASVIPALPCDVFRLARIAVHPPEEDTLVFRTSGTSQGREARGEHPFRTTATYELVALRWGERMLWPDQEDLGVLVLAPSVEEVSDSSLGFMLDRFARELGGPASFHVRGGELDIEGLSRAAAEARARGRSMLVLGASFAFVHLLDGAGARDLTLPPGSRVMQTGGFKGRSREVEPAELRRAIAATFGLPEAHVVGEYGMTELSSQLYEGTLAAALGVRAPARHGVYVSPPWMRVTAVDAATLAPLPPGETGILRFVDLANVDASVAIQTSDLGRVTAEGVELFGRAPGATPRGCSLAIDDVLARGSS
nr:acyl-protein synthetase [Polyangium spumosum]